MIMRGFTKRSNLKQKLKVEFRLRWTFIRKLNIKAFKLQQITAITTNKLKINTSIYVRKKGFQ